MFAKTARACENTDRNTKVTAPGNLSGGQKTWPGLS